MEFYNSVVVINQFDSECYILIQNEIYVGMHMENLNHLRGQPGVWMVYF